MNKQRDSSGREVTPGGGGLRAWFKDFVNLRHGSDRAGTIQTIVNGRLMRGSNAWMLICSILIASLGLNMNSGAIIIGAMLISPLMNPILGIGLGVGINDRELLVTALKNFGVAIIIALLASSIYFFFTPLNTFTAEMRARTEPTVLDGLVAVFGGLAGIISISRHEKTSAIPGVAIATALMPPLCVAGYGLTEGLRTGGDFTIFWRSFYLFFLNSFFIAATGYLIIRAMRFGYHSYTDQRDHRRSQWAIALFSILMILPGYYILRDVLQRQQQNHAVEAFTMKFFPTAMSSSIFDRRNPKEPLLIFPMVERPVSPDSLEVLSKILRSPPYGVGGARVVVDTSYSPTEIANIKGELAGLEDISSRVTALEQAGVLQELEVARTREELDLYRLDSAKFVRFSAQIMVAFPQVEAIHMARAQAMRRFGPDDKVPYAEKVPLLVVKAGRQRLPAGDLERLGTFVELRLAVDSVVVLLEPH